MPGVPSSRPVAVDRPKPAPPSARERLNLIEALSRDAVASDYEGAVITPRAGSRRQQMVVVAAAVGLVGFVLALGFSARVLNDPVVNDQRTALMERTTAEDSRRGELARQVADLRSQVSAARTQDLAVTLAGRVLAQEIEDLELSTGYIAVKGPGVVVTLSDAPSDDQGEPPGDLQRVKDFDVQAAVNGLWYAGAEAIAINGQRLSARSAIRSAGDAILVNYRPVPPPYAIEAIGDPDTLPERFRASPDAAALRGVSEKFGIGFTTQPDDDLRLPEATSALPEEASVVDSGEGNG